jgi:hypothetical protein
MSAADDRYNHSEKGRERKRAQDRRLRHTPGTYRYMEAHGIGLPGIKHRLAQNQRRRNLANARDEERIRELRAYLASGTHVSFMDWRLVIFSEDAA